MDLGACPKSHTDRLKTEFIAAKEAEPQNPIFSKFQMEYEANIFSFVDECDRRIRSAHRRLEKTPEENAKTTNLVRLPEPVAYTSANLRVSDARNCRNRVGHSGWYRENRGVR